MNCSYNVPRGVFLISDKHPPSALKGYEKAYTLMILRYLGLPTLEGLVVKTWNNATSAYLSYFIQFHGWNEVMIRSDKKPETDFQIRGGYIIRFEQLSDEIKRLFRLGRIVMLLEPASRYADLYSINVLLSDNEQQALIEIVGPGFDATDLKRGEVSPHEVIYLEVKDKRVSNRVLSRKIIDNESYKSSVSIRLAKIGKEVSSESCSITDRIMTRADYENIAKQYLSTSGYNLLLNSAKEYIPLPDGYLLQFIKYIKNLPWQLCSFGKEQNYIISCSILGQSKPRMIFWDIVRPSRKYSLT